MRSPVHYALNGKDTLLVTIGDSWTWGDSLGKIDATLGIVDDYAHRTTSIYGYHLSSMLDTDWVNYAICGIDNITVLTDAFTQLSHLIDEYSKIYVVVTLTETSRELNRDRFLNKALEYNTIRGADWPVFSDLLLSDYSTISNVIAECYRNNYLIAPDIEIAYACHTNSTVLGLLEELERITFHFLLHLASSSSNIIIYTGRNFTNTFANNTSYPGVNLIPLTWVDVIAVNGKLKPYPASVRVVSSIGMTPLLSLFDKEQLIPLLDHAINASNWLHNSPFNAKIATKHPMEQAHHWWANYIYSIITESNVEL